MSRVKLHARRRLTARSTIIESEAFSSNYNPLLLPVVARHVFDYLDVVDKCRAAQVCSLFRDLAYNSRSLWRNDLLRVHISRANVSAISAARQRGINRILIYGHAVKKSSRRDTR